MGCARMRLVAALVWVVMAVAAAGTVGSLCGCGVMRLEARERLLLDRVPLRYGKGAVEPTAFVVSEAAWGRIAAMFEEEAALDAAAERERIAMAIGEFERIAGQQGPTWADRAGNNWPRLTGVEGVGQMDCVDESTNTTNYLVLLEQEGLLRRHEVMTPVRRYRYIIAAHRTAVVREVETGELFAVDSWFKDNGRPAVVQELGVWRSGREDEFETVWE